MLQLFVRQGEGKSLILWLQPHWLSLPVLTA
jgi:hypothetical protein